MKKLLLFPIIIILSSCSIISAPWTQEKIDKLRQEFCVDLMGERSDSQSCDCFIEATKREYKTFTSFARSNGPTEQYRKELLWCGYVLH